MFGRVCLDDVALDVIATDPNPGEPWSCDRLQDALYLRAWLPWKSRKAIYGGLYRILFTNRGDLFLSRKVGVRDCVSTPNLNGGQ